MEECKLGIVFAEQRELRNFLGIPSTSKINARQLQAYVDRKVGELSENRQNSKD